MRKVIAAGALGVVMLLALALPAHAQSAARDPFQPAVIIGPATAVDGTVPATADVTDTGPAATTSETMATTGADPRPWLLLAVTLTAIGAGLVALADNARRNPYRGAAKAP